MLCKSHCFTNMKRKSKADDANNRKVFLNISASAVYSVVDFPGSHVNVFGHLVTEAGRNTSSDAILSKNLQL